MKVAEVRSRIVGNTWKNWLLVEVVTDSGAVGVGEATLEHRTLAAREAVGELAHKLVGRPIEAINDLVERMRRETYTPGILVNTVLSGMETALWDLLGQALGVPVTTLFGGALRSEVRAYANGWYRVERRPEAFAEAARAAAAHGYSALKFDPFGSAKGPLDGPELALCLAIARAVREAVGPAVDLIVEGHARLTYASALYAAEGLAEIRPLWYEEPLRADDLNNLEALCRRSPVPIGVGERAVALAEFKALLDHGPIGVLQPDVVHVGGLMAARQIAALADAYDVPVAFHNPQGPFSTAASLQLAAVVPNAWVQEYFADFDPPWTRALTDPAIVLRDGMLQVPTGPGLGVRLVAGVADAHPYSAENAQHLFSAGWERRRGLDPVVRRPPADA